MASTWPSFYIDDFNDDEYWDIFIIDTYGVITWYKGSIPRYVDESAKDNMPEDQVYIAPNPVKVNQTKIQYVVRDDSSVKVEVFTMNNRKIKEYTAQAHFTQLNEVNLDTTGLRNGVYMVKIEAISLANGQKSTVLKKLVVLK